MNIMLDTGSSISFISEETKMSIPSLAKRPIKKKFVMSQAVTGQSLDTLGMVDITFSLGSHTLQQEVQVIRNVSQGFILGFDFLTPHRVILDMGRGLCYLGDDVLPLLKKSSLVPAVCTAQMMENTTIPPCSEFICKVALISPVITAGIPNCYSGYLEPRQLELDGIAVARTLSTVENGCTVVRIINPTHGPMVLYSGMQLGQFTPVSNTEVILDSAPVCKVSTAPLQPTKLPFPVKCGDLTSAEQSELHSLISSYADVFSKTSSDYGSTDIVKHKINTGQAPPVRKRAYRTSPKMQTVIQSHVEEMLEKGLVENSHSPWAAPVVMVRKKDGSWRFCVDYRGLNAVTVKDAHPLPRTDDTLDALGGSSVFSTMDLSSGYWQVQLDEQDKAKTAFTTGRGLYQFCVMPMGLVNAPPTFQHLMQLVLQGLSWKTCLVYLDDIIVYSPSFSVHLEHLREVFDRIRAANLKLKPSKCCFAQQEVTFLGHVVSAAGVKPDPRNTDKVRDWPVPKNPAEARAFVSLCSYYRRFIYQFAKMSEPLHALTQKGKEFLWTDVEQRAFESLRHALCNTPVLSYPDFSQEFLLFTDASNTAIGCVLSQKDAANREHVIAYGSRILTKTEKRWSTYDRELWAIVWGIRHFRQYLTGHPFRILTDHKPLLSLRKMPLDCDPTGRRARWALEIDPYEWTIEYKQGTKHANADSMSRRPSTEIEASPVVTDNQVRCVSIHTQTVPAESVTCSANRELALSSKTVPTTSPTTNVISHTLSTVPDVAARPVDNSLLTTMDREYLIQAQQADPELQIVRDWVLIGQRPPFSRIKATSPVLRQYWREFPKITLVDNLLCRTVRPPPGDLVLQTVVPSSLQKEVFRFLHGHPLSGHFSAQKTLQGAQVRCFWPNMTRDITQWCLECTACEARRPPTPHQQAPMQNIVTSRPFEKIGADLTELPLTSRGNRYVLVVMDYFTKYVNLYALPDQRATTVAKCLFEDYISCHGVFQALHTDQGRQFESDLVKGLCASLGITKTRTTPYHPECDGMVERHNRTMKDQLAKILYDRGGEWDDYIRQIEFAYNTTVHSSTNHTPFFLAHGREACLPADLLLGGPPGVSQATTGTPGDYATSIAQRLCTAFHAVDQNIEAAGAQQKHYHDRRMKHAAYEQGDLVWVDLPALSRCKLAPKWAGPFKVLKRMDSHTGDIGVDYEILDQRDPRAKPKIIHYNRLKPYRSAWSADQHPTPPVTPAVPTCSSGPPPLTALSGSRPNVYQRPVATNGCSVPRAGTQSQVNPLSQHPVHPAPQVEGTAAVGHSSGQTTVQPLPGLRTRTGRCIRPPTRYGYDE